MSLVPRGRLAGALLGLAMLNGCTQGQAEVARQLRFEQFGVGNATLKPFAVQVGRLGESSRDVVFVTPAGFDGLVTMTAPSATAVAVSPVDAATSLRFQVTASGPGQAARVTVLGPAQMRAVTQLVLALFNLERQPVPAFVAALDQTLADDR